MPTATLTSKGQITIPVELRTRFHLETGDRLDFWEDETGLHLTARTKTVDDLFGMLRTDRAPLSIEDMDDAIGQAATSEALP